MEGVKNPGPVVVAKPKKNGLRWFWPASVIAAGVTGAAVIMMRGCWHRKLSWPLSVHGSSYRVCLGCGIKRLFDEPSFTSYGPYSYDLNELKVWDEARQEANRATVIKRAS